MNKFSLFVLFLVIVVAAPSASIAQDSAGGTKIDQIVAIVNSHVILKSDVDKRVQQTLMQLRQSRNQQISFGKDIWYSTLQNMVDQDVMLDQAKIDSIEVTQSQVDQAIDQKIKQYVQQVGSEEALEKQLGKSLLQIKSDLRDGYREQMIVQKFMQQKRSKIKITRPEVRTFFNKIPKDSLPTIPEQAAVSQIVKLPKPLKDAKEKARKLAEAIRDSVLHYGKSMEEMAKKYSDGPSAPNGGKLPMMAMNDLVPEYSAAAAAMKPGQISKVVETSFGFHIIRLNKRQGDQIDTNHILIEVNKKSYDDQAAINRLKQIRDSIFTNKDVKFAQVARKLSEDPNTAPQGGRLLNPQTGERLIALNQFDPALYSIVLLLNKVGDISQPKPFTLGNNEENSKKGFRIVRLDRHVPEHQANLDQDFARIKSNALQAKQQRKMRQTIGELRKEMYVNYKINVPKKYRYL